MARSVLWNGKPLRSLPPEPFLPLLKQVTPLAPSFHSLKNAPEALQGWMTTEEHLEVHLPAFLGLSGHHRKFVHWLVGEHPDLNDLQVLASMRHVVAHGNLSPSKALSWGLRDLYATAPGVLDQLAKALQRAITPT